MATWEYPDTLRDISAHPVVESWTETSGTWDDQPAFGGTYDLRSIHSDS